MKITVAKRNVFGVERIYPVCNESLLLAKLTGDKTLSSAHISIIKELGYEIVVETPKL